MKKLLLIALLMNLISCATTNESLLTPSEVKQERINEIDAIDHD